MIEKQRVNLVQSFRLSIYIKVLTNGNIATVGKLKSNALIDEIYLKLCML